MQLRTHCNKALSVKQSIKFALIALGMAASGPVFAEAPRVVDASNRAVSTPATAPQRIVVANAAALHTLIAVHSDKKAAIGKIVAVSGDFTSRDKAHFIDLVKLYPELATKPVVKFGQDGQGLSPDEVLALKPDLAIVGGGGGAVQPNSLAGKLLAAGVPVVFTDYRSNPGRNSLASIRAVAAAVGENPETNAFVTFYASELARVQDVVSQIPLSQRPSVFVELRPSAERPCCGTAGKGNIGELVEKAGGINAGSYLIETPLGQAKAASVVALKPDFYVITGSDGGAVKFGRGHKAEAAKAGLSGIAALRPDVKDIPALRNGKVIGLWHSFYNHPFNVVAVQALAQQFYPGQFGALDPKETERKAWGFLGLEPAGTYWQALGK